MGRKISLMIITTILIISNIRVTANFIYTSTDKVEEHNTQYSRYTNQIQKNVGKKLYTQDQLNKTLQEREEKRQLNMKLHNMKVGQIRNSSRTVLQKYGNGDLYTQLDLEIERVSDTKARFISIYVDGRLKMSEEVIKGGKTQISRDLGNFNRRTVHTLTIRIRSGSASETGWRINKLEVNYEALHVEVDWMNGYRPSDWIINSIEDAYKENGYERVEFYISPSSVSTDTKVDSNDLVNYYSSDSWVKASHPDNHRYILLGARSNRDNTLGFMITGRSGSDVIFYPYAFIAVEEMKEFVWRNFIIGNDLDNNIRSVILHELGHTLTLLKTLNGDEYYNWGNTIYSVMDNPRFENTIESSFYSPFLWEGDGNWWSLRSGYTATDSIVREPISQIEVV